MKTRLRATGANIGDLRQVIDRVFRDSTSASLSTAFAYTSYFGAHYLREFAKRKNLTSVALITDIRDKITHPAALRLGMDAGWLIKVVNRSQGTFHPKMIIGSRSHNAGIPVEPNEVIVGSGNLSRGGLVNNVECAIVRYGQQQLGNVASVFSDLWDLGHELTPALLASYEKAFQERNRSRSAEDMAALGVSDNLLPATPNSIKKAPAAVSSMSSNVAEAAWAGLESFTGEYTFQLEFPRDAGAVLRRMIARTGQSPLVDILCDDGVSRPMRYNFYEHNGMFRLNIPNDVPGVGAARASRTGTALIETISQGAAPLRIKVSSEPKFVTETSARSYALGTIGKTPTRLYGWY